MKHLVRRSPFAFAAFFALSALPFAAHAAANAQQEVKTANAHAMMAQSASTLKMAHAHLHHVLNCLVGPKGEAFDSNALNPCKGMGNGAVPDSASNKALNAQLKKAVSDAQAGLKDDTLQGAHKQAASTAKLLKTASAAN